MRVRGLVVSMLVASPLAAQAQTLPRTPGAPSRSAVLELPPEPSVVVIGSADLSRPPDEAELVFGVTARAPAAADAQAQVSQALSRTLDALRQLGVSEKNIHTTQVSVQPVYATSAERGSMRIEAYQARHSVEVRVSPERIGPVLDAALRDDTNQIEGLSYGIADDAAAHRAVLREAFQQARAKAEALAAAGGFQLEEVLEVVETVEPVQIGRTDWAGLGDLELARTPVAPADVGLTGRVSVRFAIGRGDERVQTRGESGEE